MVCHNIGDEDKYSTKDLEEVLDQAAGTTDQKAKPIVCIYSMHVWHAKRAKSSIYEQFYCEQPKIAGSVVHLIVYH